MKNDAQIHSYCQVLGTGDDGSSPCLLVSVERAPRYSGGEPTENTILSRYLFNVGDGTQVAVLVGEISAALPSGRCILVVLGQPCRGSGLRFCREAGVKLRRVNKLFLTGTGAEEHAGLTGLLLSLSDLGSPMLEIFGPSGVDKLVEGIRPFGPSRSTCPEVSAVPLSLGSGESQCSYVLGDEHMEIRCGVVDPARLRESKVISIESSDSSSSGSSEDSGDDSGDSSSSEEEEEEEEEEDGSSSGSSNSSSDDDVAVCCFERKQVGQASTAASAVLNSGHLGEASLGVVGQSRRAMLADEGGDPVSSRHEVDLTHSQRADGPKKHADDGNIAAGSSNRQDAAGKAPKETNGVEAATEHHGRPKASSEVERRRVVAGRRPAQPAGVPARGPAVLYRCRVLHGIGTTFLVLSCPNILYVRVVRSHALVVSARRDDGVLFVMHLSPEDVVKDAAYAPLLALKGTHVALACGDRARERGAGGLQHRKMAERSVQLNYVAPQAFPLHSALLNTGNVVDAPNKELSEEVVSKTRTIVGRPLVKAVLLPVSARGIDMSAVHPPVEMAEIRTEMETRVQEAGLAVERDRIVAELRAAHGLEVETKPHDQSVDVEESEPEALGAAESSTLPTRSELGAPSLQFCSNKLVMQGAPLLSAQPPTYFPPPPPLVCGVPPSKRARTGVDALPVPHPTPYLRPPPPVCGSTFRLPPPRVSLFPGGGLAGSEVFFLGTGSAAPSKNRGCSGILLRIPQDAVVTDGTAEGEPLRLLIDAGEGTLGHLERLFGREGALREIRGLDCVWISHKHADHHTGLFRLIAEHHRARAASHRLGALKQVGVVSPLVVVAPSTVLEFLKACTDFSGEEISYKAMSCKDTERDRHWRGGGRSGFVGRGRRGRQGASTLLDGMRSVLVVHCREAYGLVVQLWQGGAKLVYSGDTRPCDRLVKAGAGAALLIHEATFDDSMKEDARSKMHCTTSEALDVGKHMRAGEIVLTHFSQRYPRVPVLDPAREQRFCVAFDGMVLNDSTVAALPAAAKLLSQVLEPKTEEEDAQELALA